jgi:hypothetical protein
MLLELKLKFPMTAFELSIFANAAIRLVSSGDQDRIMKFPGPTGWLLGSSCVAPAIAALTMNIVVAIPDCSYLWG